MDRETWRLEEWTAKTKCRSSAACQLSNLRTWLQSKVNLTWQMLSAGDRRPSSTPMSWGKMADRRPGWLMVETFEVQLDKLISLYFWSGDKQTGCRTQLLFSCVFSGRSAESWWRSQTAVLEWMLLLNNCKGSHIGLRGRHLKMKNVGVTTVFTLQLIWSIFTAIKSYGWKWAKSTSSNTSMLEEN